VIVDRTLSEIVVRHAVPLLPRAVRA
jgi:hypothetical protein